MVQNDDENKREKTIRRTLVIIIVLSVAIRAFFAWILELGNDEVYYWTYAVYPDWGHFDHPPMVGWMIRLFSFNLQFSNELFIRMSAVLLGGLNTFMIYLIGKRINGAFAGLYAAMLYNTSVYCFVIAGVFILPDTPQLFFSLAALWFLLTALPADPIDKRAKVRMLLAGFFIGLALLSKYTAVFLWVGAGLYILFYRRRWLRTGALYFSILITLLLFSPVILWNVHNHFISFTFNSQRVSFWGNGLRPDYFFTELFGQVLYNNPVNFVIILVALVALWRKRFGKGNQQIKILLLTSLPLIFLFLFFALFRATLPHWTGPAYLSLMVVAAVWLAEKAKQTGKVILFPKAIATAAMLLLLTMILGLTEIKTGVFTSSGEKDPEKLGHNDFTLDMYGWQQFSERFLAMYRADIRSGNIGRDAPILSYRWFPAAHLDFYVAYPNHINLLVFGDLERIHKYAWINRERKPLQLGSDAWFITPSRDFKAPQPLFGQYFETIEQPEIIKIYKGKRHVENFFVYKLRNCIKVPEDVLTVNGIGME